MKKLLTLFTALLLCATTFAQQTPTNKTRSDNSFTNVDNYLVALKRLGIPTSATDDLDAAGLPQNAVKIIYNTTLGKLRIYDPVTLTWKDAASVPNLNQVVLAGGTSANSFGASSPSAGSISISTRSTHGSGLASFYAMGANGQDQASLQVNNANRNVALSLNAGGATRPMISFDNTGLDFKYYNGTLLSTIHSDGTISASPANAPNKVVTWQQLQDGLSAIPAGDLQAVTSGTGKNRTNNAVQITNMNGFNPDVPSLGLYRDSANNSSGIANMNANNTTNSSLDLTPDYIFLGGNGQGSLQLMKESESSFGVRQGLRITANNALGTYNKSELLFQEQDASNAGIKINKRLQLGGNGVNDLDAASVGQVNTLMKKGLSFYDEDLEDTIKIEYMPGAETFRVRGVASAANGNFSVGGALGANMITANFGSVTGTIPAGDSGNRITNTAWVNANTASVVNITTTGAYTTLVPSYHNYFTFNNSSGIVMSVPNPSVNAGKSITIANMNTTANMTFGGGVTPNYIFWSAGGGLVNELDIPPGRHVTMFSNGVYWVVTANSMF